MAFLNQQNLKNAQTNLNVFIIGFASCVNSSTINNLQIIDVIEDGGSKVTHVTTNAHQLKVHLEEWKKQYLV
jgi:hypothetical protein